MKRVMNQDDMFKQLADAFSKRTPRTAIMDKVMAKSLGLDVDKFDDDKLLVVDTDEKGNVKVKEL